MTPWREIDEEGPASALHRAPLPEPVVRTARWCRSVPPALVLGSTQPDDDVDPVGLARSGLDLARRRSGGAAVVVGAGRLAWVDLIIAAGDSLWSDDVVAAARWVGEAWVRALASLGVAGAETHGGRLERGRWGSRVCFASVGAGEVTVGGRKIVGVSQRRTRGAAVFQCGALLHWDGSETTRVLRLPPEAVAEVSRCAVGIADLLGRDVAEPVVREALMAALP